MQCTQIVDSAFPLVCLVTSREVEQEVERLARDKGLSRDYFYTEPLEDTEN